MVLNYEAGAENSVLHGDAASDTFLSDMINPAPVIGARRMSMEQIYEYGARAGVWRLLRLFDRHETSVTVFDTAIAQIHRTAGYRLEDLDRKGRRARIACHNNDDRVWT